MKKTAFVKKKVKQNIVLGTHTSVHNGLLLVSTGIPTLDDVLGGGLPVGSVLLVEEDMYSRFSSVLIKYFLAEGVMCQHGLFIASANQKPVEILHSLPKPVSSLSSKSEPSKSEDMKIAFMYKNMPQHTTGLLEVSKFGHYYDISSTMEETIVEKCDTKLLEIEMSTKEKYKNLFKYTLLNVKKHIDSNSQYKPPDTMTPGTVVNVLRLAIPQLASPMWCANEVENVKEIPRFLHSLRALARQSLLVCMVTIPTHLYADAQVATFRQFVDCSVQLKAFIGEKNPAFKQYHGMFEIHKLPCLNALTPKVPESFDLAFELKRTKFVIECFHLPPDMSESVGRQGMDETTKKSTPCGGTTLHNKLDF